MVLWSHNTTRVFRLKRKIACKIGDEHAAVKDLPPPNETVAKLTAKSMPSSRKQGTVKFYLLVHSVLSTYTYMVESVLFLFSRPSSTNGDWRARLPQWTR